MTRRYYSPPPLMPNQLPAFLVKSHIYDVPTKIRELIAWSKLEYNRAVVDATRHKALKFVRFLHEEYSAMRVMAEVEGFRDLLKLIDDESYNKLTGRERVFLRRAYELFKALS